MKSISTTIFFIILLSITIKISLSADICQSCLQLEDSCHPVNNPNCARGLYCNNKTLTCIKATPENGTCTNSIECDQNLSCINSTCMQARYLGVSESCTPFTSSYQCNYNLTCFPFTCSKGCNYICRVIPDGNYCDNSTQCIFSNVCHQKQCVAPKQDGKQCNFTSQCKPYSICNENVCTPPFSMDLNQNCSIDYHCDISKNLICSNGKCIQDKTKLACLTNDPSKTKENFISLEKCRFDNQCPLVENQSSKSCIYRNCMEFVEKSQNLTNVCAVQHEPSSANKSISLSSLSVYLIYTVFFYLLFTIIY